MSKGPHNPMRDSLTASVALAAAAAGQLRRCPCGCGYYLTERGRRVRRFHAQTIRFLERRGLAVVAGDRVQATVQP